MPRCQRLAVFALVAMFGAAAGAAEPLSVTGKIDAVTVYRGQALVTRVVDVPGPGGLRDIVVTGLPERVVGGSLYAEAGPDVEIRAVSYRERAVEQDVREDVRKMQAEILTIQDGLTANAREKQVSAERGAYLGKLQEFVAVTATTELTKGVLNADTLEKLTTFIFDQRQVLADADLKLGREEKTLNDRLALLRRQEAEITSGASKSVREAVVFANFKTPGGQIRINYLVDAAGWSPSYVARAGESKAPADPQHRPINLRYNASVQQMSGEDWGDVTMTLSTATPSMVATAPALDPLAITLASGPAADESGQGGYAAAKSALSTRRRLSEFARNSAGNLNINADPTQLNVNLSLGAQNAQGGRAANAGPAAQQDKELTEVADKLQVLELVAKDAGGRESRTPGGPAAEQEGVSVTYKLPGRTSLPSRADQQSIQIASLDLTGEFYKLAMPVLTSYVYDQATVTNQTKLVLLAGSVASYTDDQYVGAATLPTVSVGEQFTVGFGIDSSLRATRELVDKTDTTQGGNRVLNFKYRLAIENFGTTPVTVRLADRLPTSKNPDVRVTPDPADKPATVPPIGPAATGTTAKHAGILNWSVQVPAQAMGEKAFTLEYSYKLEFDKQFSIAGLPAGR
jgi:hypothetical protein